MNYLSYLPVYSKLSKDQQEILKNKSVLKTFKKGEILHNGSDDCEGLFLIISGQLRAYILSDDGKEISLYRLFERDITLFSASCMMNSIQFDIIITAQKDTEVLNIPSDVYKNIMNVSAPLANYTNELMATRFTDVMWLIDQIMWRSFDSRLASFLINEMDIENTSTLHITHEIIGNHLGCQREVVTRMLRYFSDEGFVELSRGIIHIINIKGLELIANT